MSKRVVVTDDAGVVLEDITIADDEYEEFVPILYSFDEREWTHLDTMTKGWRPQRSAFRSVQVGE